MWNSVFSLLTGIFRSIRRNIFESTLTKSGEREIGGRGLGGISKWYKWRETKKHASEELARREREMTARKGLCCKLSLLPHSRISWSAVTRRITLHTCNILSTPFYLFCIFHFAVFCKFTQDQYNLAFVSEFFYDSLPGKMGKWKQIECSKCVLAWKHVSHSYTMKTKENSK